MVPQLSAARGDNLGEFQLNSRIQGAPSLSRSVRQGGDFDLLMKAKPRRWAYQFIYEQVQGFTGSRKRNRLSRPSPHCV